MCSFDDIASLRRVITAGALLKLPLWKCMEKPFGDDIKTVNHSKFSMFLAGLVVYYISLCNSIPELFEDPAQCLHNIRLEQL